MKMNAKKFFRKYPRFSLGLLPVFAALCLYFVVEKTSEMFLLHVFSRMHYGEAENIAIGIGGFCGIVFYVLSVICVFLHLR